MDKVDRMSELRFVIDELKPVTQTLQCTPERISPSYIKFGNSGFRIRFGDDGVNSFDFMPENRLLPNGTDNTKSALMLDASMLELHHLLNDSQKLKELRLKESNITEISAVTNKVLINALEKLFLIGKVKDIVKESKTGVVTIDLQKFKNLDKSDPLIKYLERAFKMSEGMKVISWESNKK